VNSVVAPKVKVRERKSGQYYLQTDNPFVVVKLGENCKSRTDLNNNYNNKSSEEITSERLFKTSRKKNRSVSQANLKIANTDFPRILCRQKSKSVIGPLPIISLARPVEDQQEGENTFGDINKFGYQRINKTVNPTIKQRSVSQANLHEDKSNKDFQKRSVRQPSISIIDRLPDIVSSEEEEDEQALDEESELGYRKFNQKRKNQSVLKANLTGLNSSSEIPAVIRRLPNSFPSQDDKDKQLFNEEYELKYKKINQQVNPTNKNRSVSQANLSQAKSSTDFPKRLTRQRSNTIIGRSPIIIPSEDEEDEQVFDEKYELVDIRSEIFRIKDQFDDLLQALDTSLFGGDKSIGDKTCLLKNRM
jgi:hypothetical protein